MKASSITSRLEGLTKQINQLRNESRLANANDIFYYHSKIGQLSEQKNKLNRQLKRMEIK
jgi:uncharacterized phage infection (PIP) family protein YhgE